MPDIVQTIHQAYVDAARRHPDQHLSNPAARLATWSENGHIWQAAIEVARSVNPLCSADISPIENCMGGRRELDGRMQGPMRSCSKRGRRSMTLQLADRSGQLALLVSFTFIARDLTTIIGCSPEEAPMAAAWRRRAPIAAKRSACSICSKS